MTVTDRLKEASFYVGPVRNSTPENAQTALPIVKLVPDNKESTVDELFDAWTFYVRKRGIEVKDRPAFVLHRDKKVALGKDIKIGDVIDTRVLRHYFCLPPAPQDNSKEATSDRSSVDEESIDKLVACIEVVEEYAEGTKKKKKTKKGRVCAKVQKKKAESLRTDQVQSCPHLAPLPDHDTKT